MPVKRTDKLNDEIARELSRFIQDMKDPRMKRGLPSVVRVETAADLAQAKVHVSVLGSAEEQRGVFDALKAASGFLRRELASAMKLRHTPELKFLRDESLGRGAGVLKIMDVIDIPAETEEGGA